LILTQISIKIKKCEYTSVTILVLALMYRYIDIDIHILNIFVDNK